MHCDDEWEWTGLKKLGRKTLITGVAGFIGSHLATTLLRRGQTVIGLDNLNDYYDTQLKRDRLNWIGSDPNFTFYRSDITDFAELQRIINELDVDAVVHLAAQAGVRYSIDNPEAYGHSNLLGHLNVLEAIRHSRKRPLLVYASSSSVYGNSSIAPFNESEPANSPVSLYAATKRGCELMSESYSNLYGLRQIGLRFFTVYGPWGRPDMAYWLFADRIFNQEPIKLFNNGNLRRDFTWIGDIIKGIESILNEAGTVLQTKPSTHAIYNLGNGQPIGLLEFVTHLENAIGKSAVKQFVEMQQGDVYESFADISAANADFGFQPATRPQQGLSEFVSWLKQYRAIPHFNAGAAT